MLAPALDDWSDATRRSWLVASAALAFALAWIVFGYWRTGAAMVAIWARSDTFAHGFLVAPIAAWLSLALRANRCSQVAPQPSWWVLVPLTAAGAAWLLGDLGTVNAVSQFAFVAMLVLAVPAVHRHARGAAHRLSARLPFLRRARGRVPDAAADGMDGRLHGRCAPVDRHSGLSRRAEFQHPVRQLVGRGGVQRRALPDRLARHRHAVRVSHVSLDHAPARSSSASRFSCRSSPTGCAPT